MKCKIISGPYNNNLLDYLEIEEDDYVIGADIGAYMLAENNISFDLALGDFDSVDESQLEQIKKYAKSVLDYPVKKDSTDTYIAVEEAFKRGYTDITIYGGLGNRIDHSLANIQLLKLGDIKIVTKNEVMYTLDPGTYDINNIFKYISFFALEDVSNLTLQGFEYELTNYNLSVDDPICVSNKGKGILSFEEGCMLVIHQNE